MTHKLKRQAIYFASTASLILGCSLSMAPVALSEYRPPKTPSAPKDTGSNATRGGSCESNPTTGLTALAPLSHVGRTSTQYPTFVWFVPDRTPRLLQFRLFTSTGQPLYKTQMQSQPGIMSFSLPQDQPGLTIGQSYQWQVVLVCDPQVSSRNVVATAEIQVVKPAASLQTQLVAAPMPQQQSDLYAEAGLWYDALATALKASETAQNQSAVLDLIGSLASSEAQSSKDWSDRLIQIQKIERQQQEPRQPPQPKL